MNFCYRRGLLKVVPILVALGIAGTGCKDVSTTASVTSEAKGGAAVASLPADSPTTPAAAPRPATTKRLAATPRKPVVSRTGELVMAGGIVMPNRALTPGAANPSVTQATIHSTICRTGYTKTIRPSSSYTTGLKRQQLAAGYTFHRDLSTSDYEEDHLISLELGGSPTSVKNLWPEPYAAAEGARVKDKIENQLHDLVCSGQVSLRAAQHAIATNWWKALQLYGGAGVPQVWDGAYAAAPAAKTSGGSSTTSSGATAQCRDGSYSHSQHRSGTCSHHGGVARWINPPPS